MGVWKSSPTVDINRENSNLQESIPKTQPISRGSRRPSCWWIINAILACWLPNIPLTARSIATKIKGTKSFYPQAPTASNVCSHHWWGESLDICRTGRRPPPKKIVIRITTDEGSSSGPLAITNCLQSIICLFLVQTASALMEIPIPDHLVI